MDEQATIAMLGSLKDGDKPLEAGDSFHHPAWGPVRVSKVYGWEGGFQLKRRNGAYNFDPTRVLVVSVFRPGYKKAQKVNLLQPEVRTKEAAA
jgi:hypothetical protein